MMRLQEFASSRGRGLMKVHGAEGDHNSNWAISYGDMITLLLGFFVIFFSVEPADSELTKLQQLVEKEFQALPEREIASTWGNSELMPVSLVKTNLKSDKLIVEFPQVSFFDSAQTQLTSSGHEILSRFARTFGEHSEGNRIIVRGYTDNRPVKAKTSRRFKDNLELSSLRAISALRALNSEGVPYDKMRIGGYGETDKGDKISAKELLEYDRKIVLVVEPLDRTERGLARLHLIDGNQRKSDNQEERL